MEVIFNVFLLCRVDRNKSYLQCVSPMSSRFFNAFLLYRVDRNGSYLQCVSLYRVDRKGSLSSMFLSISSSS